VNGFKKIAEQRRNAGNPYAEIGGVWLRRQRAGAELRGGFAVCRRADPEEMPAVPEHAVVRPTGGERSHGADRYEIHDKHDRRKNRKRQNTVRDHLVYLVRSAQAPPVFDLEAVLNDGVDIGIALGGDYAFAVVIHFRFAALDVRVDMLSPLRRQLHLLHDFLIALKQLNRKKALPLVRHIMEHGFLNMRQGMFHAAGKTVQRYRLGSARRLDRHIGGVQNTLFLQRGYLRDPAPKLFREPGAVNLVAVFPDHIHHVQRHDDRYAQLRELRRQE